MPSALGVMVATIPEHEISAYITCVWLLLVLFSVITVLHLQLLVGDLIRRWRCPKVCDLDLLTAGRDLENWVNRGFQRSAAVVEHDLGEWSVTLRDPDLLLVGAAALQVYTSFDRSLPATIQEALRQANALENSPAL